MGPVDSAYPYAIGSHGSSVSGVSGVSIFATGTITCLDCSPLRSQRSLFARCRWFDFVRTHTRVVTRVAGCFFAGLELAWWNAFTCGWAMDDPLDHSSYKMAVAASGLSTGLRMLLYWTLGPLPPGIYL